MTRFMPLLLLVAPLAACATPQSAPAAPVIPMANRNDCGALQYQSLVGKPVSSPGVPVWGRRIYSDSTVVTDLVSSRLNIAIDENGIITSVSCG